MRKWTFSDTLWALNFGAIPLCLTLIILPPYDLFTVIAVLAVLIVIGVNLMVWCGWQTKFRAGVYLYQENLFTGKRRAKRWREGYSPIDRDWLARLPHHRVD